MDQINKLGSILDLKQRPSRRRAVVWQTIGGYISNGIIIIQGFILIPLYVHSFGSELYGFWLASGGVLAWLSMIDVGGGSITRQRCAHAYGDNQLQRVLDYFWHGTAVMSAIIAVYAVLVIVIVPWIPTLIQVDEQYRDIILNCLYLVGIGSALHLAEQFLREFVNSCQRTLLTSLGTIAGLISALLVTIIGLLVFHWGLYALAVATIVRPSIPLVCNSIFSAILLLSTHCNVIWSKVVFRDYLVTTPAVFGAKGVSAFTAQLPVILLTRWSGPEITVAYTVSMRMLDMAKHFINQPLSAFYTSSAHLFGDNTRSTQHKSGIFSKLATGFVSATAAAFTVYVLINEGFVSLWVSDVDFIGSLFVALAALAVTLQLRNMLYVNLLGASGAIQISAYTVSLEKLLTAVLLAVLVYVFGAIGIVLAWILGCLLFQIPYHKILSKHEPEVARSLLLLQWAWIPVCILFAIATKLSHLCVVETWAEFLIRFAVILPVPAIVVLLVFPDLRRKGTQVVEQINRTFRSSL